MYLKALEIQGFKSFPERTRLSFERDVTAIVGPNGSGKSNISDAILWVMGEQSSRTLRGGKMQDVIFGGTARRASMGVAQVTLMFSTAIAQQAALRSRLAAIAATIILTALFLASGICIASLYCLRF